MKTFKLVLVMLIAAIPLLSQNPYMVKLINPGSDAKPEKFTDFNGKLIFRALSKNNGMEPWISDGTEIGTFMLKNINASIEISSGNSNPDHFTVFNNRVIFSARNAENGEELWITDGTSEGTKLLKDINNNGDSNPKDFMAFKNKLFFTANDGVNGEELWITDGTESGTKLFLDIFKGKMGSTPNSKRVCGEYVYFSADNGSEGHELWISDGSIEGTKILSDLNIGANGSSPKQFMRLNDLVFFVANDGFEGNELWISDGSEEGTFLLKDIYTGKESSNPANFFISDSRLFFTANDGKNGVELWSSDGTEEGTNMIVDLNPKGSSNPSNFIELVPEFYLFSADNGDLGSELYQLYIQDGNSETELIQDFLPGLKGSNPGNMVTTGSDIYFCADNIEYGREIYFISSGSEAIKLLKDINPGNKNSRVEEIIFSGQHLFFQADNGRDSLQLWALKAPFSELLVKKQATNLLPNDTLDFGEVEFDKPTEVKLNLKNKGNSILRIFEIDAENLDNFSTELEVDFLNAGDSTFLKIEFTPQGIGEFMEKFNIISYSVKNKVYPINLKGKGVILASQLYIKNNENFISNNSTYDFGSVFIGKDSTLQLKLINSGNIKLDLTDIELNGSQYKIDSLPRFILPDSSFDFRVRFLPINSGIQTGSITFKTNDTENKIVKINFTGKGIPLTNVDNLLMTEVDIFPNPVSDFLHIKVSEKLKNAHYYLMSPDDRVVKNFSLSSGEEYIISVEDLPKGVYILKIIENDRMATYKIVKL